MLKPGVLKYSVVSLRRSLLALPQGRKQSQNLGKNYTSQVRRGLLALKLFLST